MEHFIVRPNWQPMKTAPKDRPICIRARSVDLHTGKYRYHNYELYWSGCPHNRWQSPDDGSFIYDEEPFIKEPETGLYRGFELMGWCEFHEIKYSVAIGGTDFEYHLGDGMY